VGDHARHVQQLVALRARLAGKLEEHKKLFAQLD
jgi:hypothetical protein